MKDFFANILNFVSRNTLLVVLLLLLMCVAPQVFGVLAIIILVPLLVAIVSGYVLIYRLRRTAREASEEYQRRRGEYSSPHTNREGEVRVVKTESQTKKVNDDVGEYIDFKEIKDK